MADHLTDLAEMLRDGYDPGDVNRVLDEIGDRTGFDIVWPWNYFDDAVYEGDSELYVQADDTLHLLGGDLWSWLSDGKATGLDGPGDPGSWTGERTELLAGELSGGDGRNFAIECSI